MQMGPWQILLIAIVVLVLFGRGKVSNLMGEVGKGISSPSRSGIKDGTEEIEREAADVRQGCDARPKRTRSEGRLRPVLCAVEGP